MKKSEKDFVVVWHYCANYGKDFVKAESPNEAVEKHPFFSRKDIELIAFENNIKTSAIKLKGSVRVLNKEVSQ